MEPLEEEQMSSMRLLHREQLLMSNPIAPNTLLADKSSPPNLQASQGTDSLAQAQARRLDVDMCVKTELILF